MLVPSLILTLGLALPACGDRADDTGTVDDGGASDGGSTDGGSADGGATDGGSSDGGSADGGSSDGGSSDGGSSDGGSSDGGSSDGGSADGGSSDGGSSDGGSSDGGSADGGSSDGGSSDGGSSDVLDSESLAAGDLVISEAMVWSELSWEGGQWLELYNASGSTIELEGVMLTGSGSWTIDESYLLDDGAYVVIGGSDDPIETGGAPVDIVWDSSFNLVEGEESWPVGVRAAVGVVDSVPFDWEWGWLWNESYTLDPDSLDADDNDDSAAWCAGTSSYGLHDWLYTGTPGEANDDCPDDNDGDGYTEDVDCDDDDASVYPGATDSPYDGVDADCAGDSDYDADGDGYDSADELSSGTDCDDSDAHVRPDAYDIPGDDVDSDCDGEDAEGDAVLGAWDLAEGDLVLSEIMAWPTTTEEGWWVEVYVAADTDVLLDGIGLDLEWGSCEAVSSTVIEAGGYFLLGGLDDPRETGVAIDIHCPDMYLWELSGPLRVLADGEVIDQVSFDGDVDMEWGTAIGVQPDSLDYESNDDLDNWCIAVDTYGFGDYGTPGAENTCPADDDDDGFDTTEDCDDADDSIYPGAPETWYDGVDSDCAGDDDYDADGDGFRHEDYSGADCDDSDADINPDEFDLPDDDIDQDCDGEDATGFSVLTIDDLAEGDLVINEFLPYPMVAPEAPWFEVANLTGEAVLLDDLRIDTLYDYHVIDGGLVVAADDVLVFGVDDDLRSNGGVPVDYADSELWMGWEEEGSITLTAGRTTIDSISYRWGDWPLEEGVSTSLDPALMDATSNDDPDSWCAGTGDFGDGDLGSPGEENPDC